MMNKTFRMAARSVLGLLLLTMCAGAIAKDSPARLRSEMVKAEKQYFELYNKLNTDPQFEIVCFNDKPTGSNFATRVCRARYLLDARQTSAREHMQGAISASATSGPGNAAGANAGIPLAGAGVPAQPEKDEAFRKNVLQIQKNSPELQALGRKRDELQKRLDDASDDKDGGH
jgi:hypothetical protein